jgi:modification methylase
MPRKTTTSSFGTSKREGHDASKFYGRSLYAGQGAEPERPQVAENGPAPQSAAEDGEQPAPGHTPPSTQPAGWMDQIYCASAEQIPVPDGSVGLAFTSPPYNNGKDYDQDMSLEEYLALIGRVAREVHRVLVPGGRYVINIANLGRKPYIPLHAHFYRLHMEAGFVPMGEVIWQKARGANNSCAWGSWRSARSPRLRDIHEYLLVLAKERVSRRERGTSDMTGQEFMEATLSIWEIPPESARKVGHPAPFPVALAARVIKLFSYVDDVVLDPFAGSGTTCVAAAQLGRHYVGMDVSPEYCELARKRVSGEVQAMKTAPTNS